MKKETSNLPENEAMQYEPVLCPVCGAKIDCYCESSVEQPFAHYNPMVGMMIYGPYSSDKDVKCQNEKHIHFQFSDGENRLVKLGCETDRIDGDEMPY